MAHNTQLTQESWGLTSALQYDILNVFIHLGLDYQQSQPYQPPEQENNDDEEENNDDNEEDKDDDEEDPDEGEQDFDEEDWASSKLGGVTLPGKSSHPSFLFSSHAKKIIIINNSSNK